MRAASCSEFPYDPISAAHRLATHEGTPEAREAAVDRLAEQLGRPADTLANDWEFVAF